MKFDEKKYVFRCEFMNGGKYLLHNDNTLEVITADDKKYTTKITDEVMPLIRDLLIEKKRISLCFLRVPEGTTLDDE